MFQSCKKIFVIVLNIFQIILEYFVNKQGIVEDLILIPNIDIKEGHQN